MAPANDLPRIFRQQAGVQVDSAVEAFSGLYPFYGGTGTWELLFTRHRLIERRGDALTVWGAFSGLAPTRPRETFALRDLALVATGSGTGRADRYDQIRLGNKRFWVHSSDRAQVAAWLSAAIGPA